MQRGNSLNRNPIRDLKGMMQYWKRFHDGQDTIVMCLELQQRLLYDEHRLSLKREIEMYRKVGRKMKEHNDQRLVS